MKKAKIIISLIAISVFLFSCSNKSKNINSEDASAEQTTTFASENENRDALKEIKISTQIWATKNLNVSTFKNGDRIVEAKTNEEWIKACNEKKPAWCYYDNDSVNGKIYGKLYNWYSVSDPRGLAPKEWHIPGDSEWITLIRFLGGDSVARTKIKKINEWNDYDQIGRDFNGKFHIDFVDFVFPIPVGCWTSSESRVSDSWYCCLGYRIIDIGHYEYYHSIGLAVRCIKD